MVALALRHRKQEIANYLSDNGANLDLADRDVR
jgi:hypothetical protein